VACLDHDDAWVPAKLATQLAYLNDHPEADGVDSMMQTSYRDGKILLWGKDRPVFCLEAALKENQIFNQMLLIKRSALLAVGGFDSAIKIWDDQAISIRLAAAGFRIDHIDESLGLHRRHSGNASGRTAAMVWDGLRMLWKYRMLYEETFGWRSFPARFAYVLETAGRKRGKLLGRVLRLAGSAFNSLGSYKHRTLVCELGR
jgi:GT2 family glycosyltransferase